MAETDAVRDVTWDTAGGADSAGFTVSKSAGAGKTAEGAGFTDVLRLMGIV